MVPAPDLTCSYESPQRTVLPIASLNLERTNGLNMLDERPAKAHIGKPMLFEVVLVKLHTASQFRPPQSIASPSIFTPKLFIYEHIDISFECTAALYAMSGSFWSIFMSNVSCQMTCDVVSGLNATSKAVAA